MKLVIAHLYPEQMNIYGDNGNLAALAFRLKSRGIDFRIRKINLNTPLKNNSFDLLFGGGGQDRQQAAIAPSLIKHKKVILQAAQANIPMLVICGTYQLFGRFFQPFNQPKLTGIGVFDAYTTASHQRKIGNILTQLNPKISSSPSTLIGFENHSGNTFLGKNCRPLGKVIKGFGNNGFDKTEGAVVNNVFGSYLHGPLLPKNPHLCDYLIQAALKIKYGSVKLETLNDQLEWQAHQAAVKKTKSLWLKL